MIKINEVPVGFPAKMANGIQIRIIPFQTIDLSCSTYYELFKVTEVTNDEGEISELVEKLADGNSPITEEQFALWGKDIVYIENIVLTNLGLTRSE